MTNLLFSINAMSDALAEGLKNSLGIFYLIIINAFGAIAILLKICEFQFKKRKTIFIVASLTFVCWIAYFFLQGDFASGIINFICFVEVMVFLQRGKKKWADGKWLMYLFLGLQLGLGLLTFKNWHDIFAIVGGVFTTIAYFVISKKTYRYVSLVAMLLWVANSVSKFYYVALINDVFATVSVFVSILRFYVFNKNSDQEQLQETTAEQN